MELGRKCSIENCNDEYYAKGYCRIRYQKWKTHGNPLFLKIRSRSRCLVQDCEELAIAKGYSPKHYMKWKRYGNPLAVCERTRSQCTIKRL